MKNLGTRVLVAAVGIPAIILLSWEGGIPFAAFVALVSTIGLLELYRLAGAKGVFPQRVTGVVFGLCVNGVFIFDRIRDAAVAGLNARGIAVSAPSMLQALLILLLLFVPWMLIREMTRNRGSALLNIAVTVFGVLYVSLLFGSLTGLRELFNPHDFPAHRFFGTVGPGLTDEATLQIKRWGAYTMVTVFAAVWLCDTAAYFAGIAFGRHSLFERVSPKKTWEGAVAGCVAAVAVFFGAKELFIPYLSTADVLVCGVIVGVFGQIGDLGESLLKRDAGVKDSSSLIPGHGGVLDRFDSLLYASPLLFLYMDFVVFAP